MHIQARLEYRQSLFHQQILKFATIIYKGVIDLAVRYPITLNVSEPNNNIGLLKIRQADEETQTLVVQILEDALPKSYEGLEVFFCARIGQTAGLGIIEQKLHESEMTDPKNGKLEYTFRAEDWQVLGRQNGYFSFRKMNDKHEYVQQFSTRDFTYEITKNIYSDGIKEVKKDGSTYIWTFEDLLRLLQEFKDSGETDFIVWFNEIKDQLSEDAAGNLMLLYQSLRDKTGQDSDFREIESNLSFMKRTNNEFMERSVNLSWFGPIGNGEEDDSKAIADATSIGNQTYFPRGVYALKSPVQALTDIVGDYATLKAQTEGIPYLVALADKDTVIIKNMKFDLNEMGRGGIHVKNAKKLIVKNCEFTGYSAEYGYYKTDSCLLIENCSQAFVSSCYFHDTGFQYGEALETLNRCITVQGSEKQFVSISDCRFERANQGIVCTGQELDIQIRSCSFEETRDNSIYLIPVKKAKIIGCTFDDKYDEAIVITGGVFIVSDCILENAPNKFFAIAGNVKSLSISNCQIISSEETLTGGIISYRSYDYKVDKLAISDCFIDICRNGSADDIFSFGNLGVIQVSNISIRVISGDIPQNVRLFSFRGAQTPLTGTFESVDFVADGGTVNSSALFVDGNINSSVKVKDCDYPCRSTNRANNQGYMYNPNVTNATGLYKQKILHGAPAPSVGTWTVGDVIFNSIPSKTSPTLNCIGWVCTVAGTPGTWNKFGILE